MRRSAFVSLLSSRLLIVSVGVLALFIVLGPAAANVVPSAYVYYNAQPAVDYPDCWSEIWECDQMQQSTQAQGYVEFEIYLAQTSGYPVTAFTADLIWPDSWGLVDYSFCRDGEGTLDGWEGNPHHLEIQFPCASQPYLFMALDLIFWVPEYGKLTADNPLLRVGCPPQDWWSDASSMFGEAGVGCEFTNQPCAFFEFECEPHFQQEELALTAVTGEATSGEVHFGASWGHLHQYGCHGRYVAHTGAPWCAAQIFNGESTFDNILSVEANAADLAPGEYSTWVQVESTTLARCIDVTLEVIDQPTAASRTSWGTVKALYR